MNFSILPSHGDKQVRIHLRNQLKIEDYFNGSEMTGIFFSYLMFEI
jgi:hypothetical protein